MDRDYFTSSFGKRVRFLRRLDGLTQAALAERAGISLEHVNKIERGAAAPSFAVVAALALALGAEPAALFLFTGVDRPPETAPDRREGRAIDWSGWNMRLGAFELDPKGQALARASGLARLLGLQSSRETLSRRRFLSRVRVEDRDAVERILDEAAAGRETQAAEFDFIGKDAMDRRGVMVMDLAGREKRGEEPVRGVVLDISERKRLERMLRDEQGKMARRIRERTARFENTIHRQERELRALEAEIEEVRAMVRAAPLGVYQSTPEGRYLFANDRLAEIYGYPSAAALLSTVGDIAAQLYAHPEERKAFLRVLEEKGRVENYPLTIRRLDGSLVRTERHARVVRDASGQISRYEGFVIDVTERLKDQRELSCYEQAFAASSDLIALVDEDFRLVMANEAILSAYGRSTEEIRDLTVMDMVPPEDFRERVKPRLEACLAGEALSYTAWVELPERGRRFVNVRYMPWRDPDTGGPMALVSARDLTETRSAEDSLRASEKTTSILFRVSSAVNTETDPEVLFRTVHRILGEVLDARNLAIGLIDMAGDRLEWVYSRGPSKPAPIENLSVVAPPLNKDNLNDFTASDAVLEVLRTGHPLRVTKKVMALTGMTASGQTPAVWMGAPIQAGREALGIMVVTHPDDEGRFSRRDMELLLSVAEQLGLGVRQARNMAALLAAKEEAVSANKAKSDFLAHMSHEIRTPLNAIIGLTDLALGAGAGGEQREYLDTVMESARHLLGVVNDILDFSRIEAHKLELERIDFDPRTLFSQTVKALGVSARQRGLWLTLDVAPDLPAALRGDPVRLRQILINLIGNALKFTEKGGVTVTVSLAGPERGRPGDPEAVRIVVGVADTGIGIAPEHLARIFERFGQAEGSTSRRFGGAGLGLTISRQLVEMMGGVIRVTSEPERGSTFSFDAVFAPGDPARVESPARSGADPEVKPGAGLRLLLAEDNPVNIKIMSIHLGKLGHAVTVAENGDQVLSALARERYDAVLMDVEMPGMDGMAAARLIRHGGDAARRVLDPRAPIIAVTAHVSAETRRQCLEAGMDDYIAKPVNLDELATILGRVLKDRSEAGGRVETSPTAAETRILDQNAAMSRLGIDAAAYGPILTVSLREFPARLSACREALARGDLAGMALNAHTLKSTAATIGAGRCQALCPVLERAARSGDRQAAGEALTRLSAAYDEVEAQLIGSLARAVNHKSAHVREEGET